MTFTYLSLGAGVQSTALLACAEFGLHDVSRPDVAIFADTQGEPAYVYQHLDRLRTLTAIPIETVSAGDLAADSIAAGRFMRLPAFSAGGGMVRRQCTREYKIAPIQRRVRELLGVKPRCRVRRPVVALVGISLDEIARVAPSREKWIERRHPLVDARLTRRDCVTLLQRIGWPVPGKSSCVYCPFHDDRYWQFLKTEHPSDFARAIEVDRGIRDSSRAGIERPVYLHRSLQPLDAVTFQPKPEWETPLFDSFSEECAGVCGV